MPSGQDYASRIREQARNALTAELGTLSQDLLALPGTLSASIQALREKLETLARIDIPMTERILNEAVEEATRQRDTERVSLAHLAHDMRLKETQEEILTLLLEEANRFAPTVMLFVVRNERLVGWSCRGCSPEVSEKFGGLSIEQSESPLLQRALVADGLTSSSDIAGEAGLALLQAEASGPFHAFPLKAVGRPVAILLAAAAGNCRCDLETLCLIMDLTGLCIENLALKILHELQVPRTADRPQAAGYAAPPRPSEAVQPSSVPQPAEAEAAVTPSETQPVPPPRGPVEPEPAPSVAEAASAERPQQPPAPPVETLESALAPEPESRPADAPAPTPGREEQVVVEQETAELREPASIETPFKDHVLAASQTSAVVTPFPTARNTSLQNQLSGDPDAAQQGHWPGTEAPRSIPFSLQTDAHRLSEEEKLHADAKRFARLLVSEIKLYNEQRVVEGRENRDVYVRLKRDIDRSRETYQKRVSASVARKIDYFHDEIVRILGENDPSTLGSDYPGPLVEM